MIYNKKTVCMSRKSLSIIFPTFAEPLHSFFLIVHHYDVSIQRNVGYVDSV
jgi:hypothetical protein